MFECLQIYYYYRHAWTLVLAAFPCLWLFLKFGCVGDFHSGEAQIMMLAYSHKVSGDSKPVNHGITRGRVTRRPKFLPRNISLFMTNAIRRRDSVQRQ